MRQADPPATRPPGRALPVGRFFGVPVYFAPSWLLIIAVITVSYSGVFLDLTEDASAGAAYVTAFSYALLLAASVLLHELGHTAVSLLLGHPVERIVIILLGGASELRSDIERPRDEFAVAVAGPVVSVAIAAGAWFGALQFPHGSSWRVLLLLLGISNGIVAAFNLLPGLPLDGGRMLRAAVWSLARSRLTGTRAAAYAGRVIAVGVLVLSVAFAATPRGLVAGIVGALSAGFIWVGAGQSLYAATVGEVLPSVTARKLLRRGVMVPPDVSVAEALRRTWEARASGILVVDSADRPLALVDEAKIRAVPLDRRPWLPVSEVARPLSPGLMLPVELAGRELLDALRRTPAPEYLVVDPVGAPAGILSGADVSRLLRQAAQ